MIHFFLFKNVFSSLQILKADGPGNTSPLLFMLSPLDDFTQSRGFTHPDDSQTNTSTKTIFNADVNLALLYRSPHNCLLFQVWLKCSLLLTAPPKWSHTHPSPLILSYLVLLPLKSNHSFTCLLSISPTTLSYEIRSFDSLFYSRA